LAEYLKPRIHKDSGITLDLADYIKEIGDKEYFLRLIKKLVRLSLEVQKGLEKIRTFGKF